MFVKEVSLGVGAGLTVLIMRVMPPPYNALVLAAIGAGGILAWYWFNRKSSASLHDWVTALRFFTPQVEAS